MILFAARVWNVFVRTLCSVLPISSTHVGKCPSFTRYAFLTLPVCSIHGANVVSVPYCTLSYAYMGEVFVTLRISFLRTYMFIYGLLYQFQRISPLFVAFKTLRREHLLWATNGVRLTIQIRLTGISLLHGELHADVRSLCSKQQCCNERFASRGNRRYSSIMLPGIFICPSHYARAIIGHIYMPSAVGGLRKALKWRMLTLLP